MINLSSAEFEELINLFVKDLVVKNYKVADVLEKYGIDFYCNGKKTLYQAIKEKNLSVDEVLSEIKKTINTEKQQVENYESWELKVLIDYIISKHHEYVRLAIPSIQIHLNEICDKYGQRYSYLYEVNKIFSLLADELTNHMYKEEQILFPLIKYLVDSERFNEKLKTHGVGTVQNPIARMEYEHNTANNYADKIKLLTSTYTLPEDACTTFELTYKELGIFEKDLHKHIHLENNILFPKAIELEKKLIYKY